VTVITGRYFYLKFTCDAYHTATKKQPNSTIYSGIFNNDILICVLKICEKSAKLSVTQHNKQIN